jgi:hypothetical protein
VPTLLEPRGQSPGDLVRQSRPNSSQPGGQPTTLAAPADPLQSTPFCASGSSGTESLELWQTTGQACIQLPQAVITLPRPRHPATAMKDYPDPCCQGPALDELWKEGRSEGMEGTEAEDAGLFAGAQFPSLEAAKRAV